MDKFLAVVYGTLLIMTVASIWNDLVSYPARQDEWEKLHPGETYIRRYKKLKRKGKI